MLHTFVMRIVDVIQIVQWSVGKCQRLFGQGFLDGVFSVKNNRISGIKSIRYINGDNRHELYIFLVQLFGQANSLSNQDQYLIVLSKLIICLGSLISQRKTSPRSQKSDINYDFSPHFAHIIIVILTDCTCRMPGLFHTLWTFRRKTCVILHTGAVLGENPRSEI